MSIYLHDGNKPKTKNIVKFGKQKCPDHKIAVFFPAIVPIRVDSMTSLVYRDQSTLWLDSLLDIAKYILYTLHFVIYNVAIHNIKRLYLLRFIIYL
jgi:hypothetical protein